MVCSRCEGADTEAEDQPITCVTLEGGPCSPYNERASIRDRIKQLVEEITKLKAKQKTLETATNAIHDPFVHKFPPEIGSRILYLSLPSFNNGGHQPKAIHRPGSAVWAAPLKLGSVCRKWRQLAWATPELWTTVYIGIEPSMMHSTVKSLPGLLHEWLARSGVLPLTIYFFHHSSSEDELSNDIHPSHGTDAFLVTAGLAIDILNLHSGRWRNLHLNASAYILKRFSSSTDPKQLVSLELGAPNVLPLSTREFMMESELNLTHLKLINFPSTSINIRWDNITHATLSELTIDEGLNFLRQASSLEYYCVSMCALRDLGLTNPIVHPRLRSLHLSTKGDLNYVLKEINLPSLEEWTQNTNDTHTTLGAMQPFLWRSGYRLKVLNLYSLRYLSTVLETLLQEIPSLERIRLSFLSTHAVAKDIMDDILTRIFYSVPECRAPTFLPHLQLIEYQINDGPYSGPPPFSWDYIPKFYRDGHRRSLKLRVFTRQLKMTDQTAVQLLQLVNEGVDLQIIDETIGGDFLENFKNQIHEQGV